LRGRNREHSTDHPIRTAPITVEPHKVYVLVCNTTEETENILYLQKLSALRASILTSSRAFHVIPLGNDARNPITHKSIRFAGTTAIFCFLTATTDTSTSIENLTPSCFSAMLQDSLVKIFVDKKFGAADTNAVENIQNVGKELNVVYRTRKFVVTKVTGTVMIRLSARPTRLSVFEHTHSGIKESSNLWLRSFIDRMSCDFYDGTPLNLFGAKDSKLNPNNGLNFRTRSYESSWHLLFFLIGILKAKL
jgi:hypothetical protein